MTAVLVIGIAALVLYNLNKANEKWSSKTKINVFKAGVMLTTASITYLILSMFM